MAVLHDFQCPDGHQFEAIWEDGLANFCPHQHVNGNGKCAKSGSIVYLPKRQANTAFGSNETAVIWEHPGTGDTKWPGRNDAPMPTRYQQQGYVRRELRSDADFARLERDKGVRSERRWFDRGSGRSFDNDGRLPDRRIGE